MAEPKLVFVGIAKSAAEGVKRPVPVLERTISEITTETGWKIFASVQVIEPGTVVMGMAVDGQQVDIVKHDDEMTDTMVEVTPPGRYKSYALHLPMRLISPENPVFPTDHVIRLYWGLPGQIKHGWKEYSEFILRITGISPVVSYSSKYDSSSDDNTDADGNSI